MFSSAVFAYIAAESTQRMPIKWGNTQIPMVFQHNSSDVTAVQSSAVINEVLNLWNVSSPVYVYAVGTSANELKYSTDQRYFGPGVVAVTVLSYDPADGRVTQGDILINQSASRGFCLTADKAASVCTTPGAGLLSRVYLGDVVAHEMGHLMGLAHSEVRDSTMLFTTYRSQFSPHGDDIAGVRSIYQATNFGSISGKISGGNRVPVFGAHVQAISTLTGRIAASSISQEDGSFSIKGLDLNDTYYIYIEPLNYLTALPDAYRSAKSEYCPGSYVGSFFEECGTGGKGHPQPLIVDNSQKNLNIGTVTIRCQLRVDEQYLREKVQSGGGHYEFYASEERPGESFVGSYSSFDPLSTTTYSATYADTVEIDLSALYFAPGSMLDLKILTTAIGSPLDFSVEISGPFGVSIDPDRGGVTAPALEAGTNRPIYNRSITYPLHSNSALNVFSVKLKPRALSEYEKAVHLPLQEYFVLKERPWMMMASVTQGGVIIATNRRDVLSDNNSCLDAPYTFAVKPNPVSAAALAGQEDSSEQVTQQQASCGTWQPPDKGGPGAGLWMVTLLLGAFLSKFIRVRRFPQ